MMNPVIFGQSQAQKGLGFVPDYQALTAWDEAERKRRQT